GQLPAARGLRLKLEAGADGVRHERLAEPGAHGVLGPPSGAVGGYDEVGGQGGQVVENPRDERLEHRPVEVEAAYHGVQRAVSGQPPRVPADVDHPGVAAAGDDDQALVLDVDDEGLV